MAVLNIFTISALLCLCLSEGVFFNLPIATNDVQPPSLGQDVKNHQDVAEAIINASVHGQGKGQSYTRLADFVDKFGSRMAGSQALEDSIDYLIQKLKDDNFDNVHGETVTVYCIGSDYLIFREGEYRFQSVLHFRSAAVPHWVRGDESARMLHPRNHRLAILGLGGSVGTLPDGITAEVLVVRSFEELTQKANQTAGKIVVFNQDYINYGASVQYRVQGASKAAELGAVATLIRSVTPFSINSPHTGMQVYEDGVTKIPTACITVEDAEMMWRMAERGERIEILLKMDAQTLPDTQSRNVVAEITGSKYPEQIVLVSGHIDSWDVGQGAMDDGGGAFISWQALSLIRQLGLQPKRTMRAVFWTAEEEGLVGAEQYYNKHKGDIKNYDLVLESDGGTFTPEGITFSGTDEAFTVMAEVMKLLEPINATQLVNSTAGGDVSFWMNSGVPGGTLVNQNDKYFYFHHTDGDTMTVQDPYQMDLCSAVWAVVSYIVADLEDMLPRN